MMPNRDFGHIPPCQYYLFQILAHKRQLSQEWLSRERAIWIYTRILVLKKALRRYMNDCLTIKMEKQQEVEE